MSLGDFFPEKDRKEFSKRKVSVGTVLKLKVLDTNPPKEKRFIVVGSTEDDLILATVYINSKVNHAINYSAELKSLHIPVSKQGRDFLDHDSFIDCSKLIERERNEIENTVKNRPHAVIGTISDEDQEIIRKTLISSPTIKGKKKKKFGFYL